MHKPVCELNSQTVLQVDSERYRYCCERKHPAHGHPQCAWSMTRTIRRLSPAQSQSLIDQRLRPPHQHWLRHLYQWKRRSQRLQTCEPVQERVPRTQVPCSDPQNFVEHPRLKQNIWWWNQFIRLDLAHCELLTATQKQKGATRRCFSDSAIWAPSEPAEAVRCWFQLQETRNFSQKSWLLLQQKWQRLRQWLPCKISIVPGKPYQHRLEHCSCSPQVSWDHEAVSGVPLQNNIARAPRWAQHLGSDPAGIVGLETCRLGLLALYQ